MNLRLAVLDDEEYWANLIKEKIKLMFPTSTIYVCNYSSEILNCNADVFFLDIELEKENGVEIAKKIKNKNKNIIILYVSSHENYVFDSMKTEPLGFIRKNRFDEDMNYYLEKLNVISKKKEQYIVLKKDNRVEKVKLENIQYIEKYNGICYFHCGDIIFTKRISLSVLLKNLSDEFILIHKSIAVNLKYVVAIHETSVIMKNGETLEIARREAKETKKKFYAFLSGMEI